jgi:Alkyl sulfatase C-terminal
MDKRAWARCCVNGAGSASPGSVGRRPKADLTLTLTHPQLLGLLASGSLDGIDAAGDPGVLRTIMSLVDEANPSFPVMTP